MTEQAAFFDLDKTVISRSSVFAVSPAFYREGLLTKGTMARGVYRQILYSLFGADEDTMESTREAMLTLTKGWDQDQVLDIVDNVLETAIRPIVFEGALELIDEHKRRGRRVFIVSSSPEEIVRPLAGFLGVDRVISTVARVEDGVYTGEIEFYAYGPYKAERIQQIALDEDIDLKASYSYSDSVTDLPMLEVVGNPVAVNPDRALRRIARERDWDILDLQRRVVLRSRIPTPPAKPTAIVLGCAVATGAFLMWYRSRFDELPGLERLLVQLRLIRPRDADLPARARTSARALGSGAVSAGRVLADAARERAERVRNGRA